MIRKGRFAVWNNREFELVSYRGNTIYAQKTHGIYN